MLCRVQRQTGGVGQEGLRRRGGIGKADRQGDAPYPAPCGGDLADAAWRACMESGRLSGDVFRGAAAPTATTTPISCTGSTCHCIQAPRFGGGNGGCPRRCSGKKAKSLIDYLVGVAGI